MPRKKSLAPKRQIEISDRDREIFRCLYETRIATIALLAQLFFDGSTFAAQRRLYDLKAAGYLAEKRRKTTVEASLLYLDRKGYEELDRVGVIASYPVPMSWERMQKRTQVKPSTIAHELAMLRVKAILYPAIARLPDFVIKEFSTWPRLHSFTAARHPTLDMRTGEKEVNPDGFLHLERHYPDRFASNMFFFIELDLSNESGVSVIVPKTYSYTDLLVNQGSLATRYGRDPSQAGLFRFRVLFVVKDKERRNNLAERLCIHGEPEAKSDTYLATMEDIDRDPLGAIWMRPNDYLHAVAGSDFEPRPSVNFHTKTYRRSIAREAFVDERLRDLELLRPLWTTKNA